MKENVLDVLMYLFENYVDEDTDIEPDRDYLHAQLADAGFRNHEIDKAFDWLEGLASQPEEDDLAEVGYGPRVLSRHEEHRLDPACRGFLLTMEQKGVLSPTARERVLERVMALESEEVDLEQLKWVVMMVLFNLPGQEATYTWLEEMVFDDVAPRLH
jgi:Smg protein